MSLCFRQTQQKQENYNARKEEAGVFLLKGHVSVIKLQHIGALIFFWAFHPNTLKPWFWHVFVSGSFYTLINDCEPPKLWFSVGHIFMKNNYIFQNKRKFNKKWHSFTNFPISLMSGLMKDSWIPKSTSKFSLPPCCLRYSIVRKTCHT